MAQTLKEYFDRINNLETEKKTIADDIKEVYAEAKAAGFDTKALKKVISLAQMDKGDREKQSELIEQYLTQLGV
jgi:uncharacterized protein (UPF0335 family)